MFLRIHARAAQAAVVPVVTAVIALATGAAVPASAHPTASASPAAPSRGRDVSRTVTLPDGEMLVVTPTQSGGRAATDLSAAATPARLISLSAGGHTEEVPADALPYLGHGLDPDLFDLSVLERAEARGRLPLQVTFRGRIPSLPGMTITRLGQGTADGYLTTSSASAFGAALARQFRTDHVSHGYGRDGLFAGGLDIAVAGAPAAGPTVRPDVAMRTLTVTGTDLSGKPDNGDGVWVFNADNEATSGPDPFYAFDNGVAQVSVPAGHYWVIGEFDGFSHSGADGLTHLDVLPTVTVDQNITVHVAAHAATSEVTMATSRPAAPVAVTFTAVLRDEHGAPQTIQWFDFPGFLWINPEARKPAVGTLQAFASGLLTSPPDVAATPYVYNLSFRDPAGIIPPQHYVAQQSHLAAVTENYYQDVPSTGAWQTIGGYPSEIGVGFIVKPLPLPGVQVQYFSAGPDLLWSSGYYTSDNDLQGGQLDDTWRVLSPGSQVMDWNRYPLHPQPDYSAGGPGGRLFPLIPSAIRTGDKLTLTIRPFSDNEPGHLGATIAGTAVIIGYEIDQNGTRIARGDGANGIPPVTLSKSPSVIRFTLDATRTSSSYLLSASTQTVWTWRSARQPDATVPPGWYCSHTLAGGPDGAHDVYRRKCAVQPMMTLEYLVRGMALDGPAPAGRQLIEVHAGHLPLAPASQITGATAAMSCDGGKSWQPAAVTAAGAGNFRVAFTAPAGCPVSLRVSAADAAGDSIAETIIRAYQARACQEVPRIPRSR